MRKWAQQQLQQQHRRSPQLAKSRATSYLIVSPSRPPVWTKNTRRCVSEDSRGRRKAVKKAEELVVASCFFVRRLVIPERRAVKRRPSLLWQDWRRTENHNTRAAVQTTPLHPPRATLTGVPANQGEDAGIASAPIGWAVRYIVWRPAQPGSLFSQMLNACTSVSPPIP